LQQIYRKTYMDIFSIGSGSSGNSICVGGDNSHILIDAGLSGKRIREGLNGKDLKPEELSGILITHEHADHVSGLGVMARRYGLPIYGTAGTIRAIRRNSSLGEIDDSLFHVVERDVDFAVGDLTVHPIHVSHDAADPVAYICTDGRKKIGVITDLGKYDDYTIGNLQDLSVIFLEANHDVNMLQVGPYPYPLKQRILSDSGHLSNETSGDLLGCILNDYVEHIFLGHLSAQNNYPELAYETVRQEVTLGENPYKASDFNITVARRNEPSERVEI